MPTISYLNKRRASADRQRRNTLARVGAIVGVLSLVVVALFQLNSPSPANSSHHHHHHHNAEVSPANLLRNHRVLVQQQFERQAKKDHDKKSAPPPPPPPEPEVEEDVAVEELLDYEDGAIELLDYEDGAIEESLVDDAVVEEPIEETSSGDSPASGKEPATKTNKSSKTQKDAASDDTHADKKDSKDDDDSHPDSDDSSQDAKSKSQADNESKGESAQSSKTSVDSKESKSRKDDKPKDEPETTSKQSGYSNESNPQSDDKQEGGSENSSKASENNKKSDEVKSPTVKAEDEKDVGVDSGPVEPTEVALNIPSKKFIMEIGNLVPNRHGSSKGSVQIVTHPEWAPIGAKHFHELVESGFYKGTKFFRVVPGFIAQFGISGSPELNEEAKKVVLEDEPVLHTNARGTLSYATSGPNTRTTQLFFNVRQDGNDFLDNEGFAPFAEVVSGMEYVDRIFAEYGEKPRQIKIHEEGDEYLNKNYPKMSYIRHIWEEKVEDADESS